MDDGYFSKNLEKLYEMRVFSMAGIFFFFISFESSD